jgi:hypothetical protein
MAIDINIASQVSQTITDGVTTTAPSENAVFDALATKADSSSLGNYVTLATNQTISAQKTFETSNNTPTVIMTHTSGSGEVLQINKSGNGEGLIVNKISGSGNAVTVNNGIVGHNFLSSNTNNTNTVLTTTAISSNGTVANGFGAKTREIYIQTAGGNSVLAAEERVRWATATDVSLQADITWGIRVDNGYRDCLRIGRENSNTAFLQVLAGSAGNAVMYVGGFVFSNFSSETLLTGNNVAGHKLVFRPAQFTARGAWTNTGLHIGGNVNPTVMLEVRSTTEQFRVEFDASNRLSTTVGATGVVTFDAVGSGAKFVFSDNIELTQTVTTETIASNRTITIVVNGTTYKLLAAV